MSVSIIVPFAPDGAQRDRNWAYLKDRYAALFPDWELVEGSCDPPWRKGVAVNAAVRASNGDVLVVADADVVIAEQALRTAVERLEHCSWVVPHRLVYRLTEAATQALMAGATGGETVIAPRRGPCGGGVVVTRRQDFDAVHGIDERFAGWGGEDISFARALDTLVGMRSRFGATLTHLYHEPLPRRPGERAAPENEALAGRYLDASGDPAAMRELVERRPYPGIEGGGVVIARRETLLDVPLDPLFQGWGSEDESWSVALRTLAGAPWRGEADLVHLHHPAQERLSRSRGSRESWNRRRLYMRARANPDEMRNLISEAHATLATAQQAGDDHPALSVGVD